MAGIHPQGSVHAAGVGGIDAPPPHYESESGIQPFDIIDAFSLDYYEGNVLKYLLRHKKKGGLNDLLKARHYLDEVIERARKLEEA